ncbi:MAG: hypothetical protein WC785_01845 [Tatlockia sp.]
MKKISFLLLASLCLGSCAQAISNGEKEYLQSRNGNALVVPSHLSGSNISHFYDLPEQKQSPQANIAPPGGAN